MNSFLSSIFLLTSLVLSTSAVAKSPETCTSLFAGSKDSVKSSIEQTRIQFLKRYSQHIFEFGRMQGLALDQNEWDQKILQLIQSKKRLNWIIKIGQLSEKAVIDFNRLSAQDQQLLVSPRSSKKNSDKLLPENLQIPKTLFDYTNLQITFFLTSDITSLKKSENRSDQDLAEVFEMHTKNFENTLDRVLTSGFHKNEFSPSTPLLKEMQGFNNNFTNLARMAWKLQSTPRAIQRIYRDLGLEQILTKEGFYLYMTIAHGFVNHRTLIHYLRHWDYQGITFPLEVNSKLTHLFPLAKDHNADLIFLDKKFIPVASIQYTPSPTGLHGVIRSYSDDHRTLSSTSFLAPEITRFYHHFIFDNKIYIWTGQNELVSYDLKTLDVVAKQPFDYIADVFVKNDKLFLVTQSHEESNYQLEVWNPMLTHRIAAIEVPVGNDKPHVEIQGSLLYVEFRGIYFDKVREYDLNKLFQGQVQLVAEVNTNGGYSHLNISRQATPPWRQFINFIKSSILFK